MASWPAIARRIRVPSGFVLAAVYLWLAQPNAPSLTLGALSIIVGLVIRGLASGHLNKNERLATTGPYAYTRNPLYLGSLIMAVGFAIAARSLWVALILIAMFVAIYLPVIRAEESYLTQRFPEFADYARRVPRFVPTLDRFAGKHGSFSWDLYWKHREYNATIGSVAILAVLIAKLLWISR
ncbi:MAG TPA: isoprenylcysteine carboxylmethyltransferase family protein [Terriglobales bacterium]|nr:isoprenylcysteine carboxylmethyltransferase family protein [Terriglobales bacterium]